MSDLGHYIGAKVVYYCRLDGCTFSTESISQSLVHAREHFEERRGR